MAQRVTHGADTEVLDDVSAALRRQSTDVDEVGGRGSAYLEKLRALWEGPDFEEFAKRWRRAHRDLDDASQALKAFSRRLAMESADQQESSSGPAIGDGGSGAVRPAATSPETSAAPSAALAGHGGPPTTFAGTPSIDHGVLLPWDATPLVPEPAILGPDIAPRPGDVDLDWPLDPGPGFPWDPSEPVIDRGELRDGDLPDGFFPLAVR